MISLALSAWFGVSHASPLDVVDLQLDALGFPANPPWSGFGPGLSATFEWHPVGGGLTAGFHQAVRVFNPALGAQVFLQSEAVFGYTVGWSKQKRAQFGLHLVGGLHYGVTHAATSATEWGYDASYTGFGITPTVGALLAFRVWATDDVAIGLQVHAPFTPFTQMYLDGQAKMLSIGVAWGPGRHRARGAGDGSRRAPSVDQRGADAHASGVRGLNLRPDPDPSGPP